MFSTRCRFKKWFKDGLVALLATRFTNPPIMAWMTAKHVAINFHVAKMLNKSERVIMVAL
jgi:hypothetical protein